MTTFKQSVKKLRFTTRDNNIYVNSAILQHTSLNDIVSNDHVQWYGDTRSEFIHRSYFVRHLIFVPVYVLRISHRLVYINLKGSYSSDSVDQVLETPRTDLVTINSMLTSGLCSYIWGYDSKITHNQSIKNIAVSVILVQAAYTEAYVLRLYVLRNRKTSNCAFFCRRHSQIDI